MTFGPNEHEKSVQVQIINDPLPESSEIFFGSLMIPHQSEFSRSAGTIIEISYNDCKIM